MNDKDNYCFSCGMVAYAHELNINSECGNCEDERHHHERRSTGMCITCTTPLDPSVDGPLQCTRCQARNPTNDPWASLTRDEWGRIKRNHSGWQPAFTNPDEPSDEDYEYLYKSLGVPNPRQPVCTCTNCGDELVWHPGNGGQWLGAHPPRDWGTLSRTSRWSEARPQTEQLVPSTTREFSVSEEEIMSTFLDRVRERMNASQGVVHAGTSNYQKAKPKKRHRHVVETNRWDRKVYSENVRPSTSIDELIDDLDIGDEHRGGERRGFDPAPELVEGMFQSFWKAAPKIASKREIERDLYPTRRLAEEMQDNPKLKELQDMTSSDAIMSTIAVDAMGDTIREILTRVQDCDGPPDPDALPGGGGKGQGQGKGKGKESGEGGEKGEQGSGGKSNQKTASGESTDEQGNGEESESESEERENGDLDEGGGGGADEFDAESEDAENQAEADWEAQFDEALDGLDLDRLTNKALEAAKDEVEEIENARKGIGLEDGEWYSMDPESRIAMADKLRTKEMKELADIVGRMRRFALGVKAQRIIDVPHEAYDVEVGNDLKRVLKPQYALLGHELTKFEFYRKYVDKELLQFKMRGKEDVGKGPIVIAIDKSGSMSGAPFRWAMGVAEALRRFAAEEDRDYYAMFFGANNDRERFDFPQGKGPFDKVLAFLGTQANGGTQFDGVLTEALEKASKSFDGEGKGKADIVFVTDGMAHLEPEWIEGFNKERERVGVRVYSVYIGGAYDTRYSGGPLGLLEKISDATIPVSELKPESVSEVFSKV